MATGDSQPADSNVSGQIGQSDAVASFQSLAGNVDDSPITILVVPPTHVYRTFAELMTELPASLGGGPLSLITEGLRSASVRFDPKTSKVAATIQSASPAAAEALAARLPDMLKACVPLVSANSGPGAQQAASELLAKLRVTSSGEQIEMSYTASDSDESGGWIAGVMRELGGPISRQAKMNRFKQIGLAIHNYASANKALPPKQELRGEGGKSGLSWRVHILPFLGDDERELWERFKLDEPWDSAHNIQLLE